MNRAVAFFAASILTLPILAAEVRLGPEIPLAPVELRSAAYDQTVPTAASNGIDYLVAWADGRRLSSDIYLTRVGTGGGPADPAGRRVSAGTNPKLASAGGEYLLVWSTASGLASLRLDANGAARSAPRAIGSDLRPIALLSNGSTYLLIGDTTTTILGLDGAPLHSVPRKPGTIVAAGVHGGHYVVADHGGALRLTNIADDGIVSEIELTSPSAPPAGTQVTAAFGADSILFAWSTGGIITVGYDGKAAPPERSLDAPNYKAVAAGWNGREFLVVFSSAISPSSGTAVFRVASDGTPLNTSALALNDKAPASDVAFASNGPASLVVWAGVEHFTFDIFARAFPDFALLAGAGPATLISQSGEAQTDVQIARGPRGVLAVWDDGDKRWLRTSASFNGGPRMTLESIEGPDYTGWPAVAVGAHVFLVVWRHAGTSGGDRLFAKRFDFDGHDLDPQPMLLLHESYDGQILMNPQTPSIAFDGSAFLVAWIAGLDLYTIRVPETGRAIDEREIMLTNSFAIRGRSPRALWTGSEYFVGCVLESFGTIVEAPSWSHIAALRLDRTGTAISLVPPATVYNFVSYGAIRLAATLGPGGPTFAWPSDLYTGEHDITIAQTTFDGKPKNGPYGVIHRSGVDDRTSVEIAWNGAEYVMVWLERIGQSGATYKLKGMRFAPNLVRLDSEPFEVSAGPAPLLPPWIVPTPAGVLIGYSRVDEANGDAPRAFMRALDRLPSHRRAAGR
jgi:hypothetical protein